MIIWQHIVIYIYIYIHLVHYNKTFHDLFTQKPRRDFLAVSRLGHDPMGVARKVVLRAALTGSRSWERRRCDWRTIMLLKGLPPWFFGNLCMVIVHSNGRGWFFFRICRVDICRDFSTIVISIVGDYSYQGFVFQMILATQQRNP